MKKKIVSAVVASVLLAGNVYGAQGYFGLGYAMTQSSSNDENGYLIDMGVKFGEKFKNRFGTEFTLRQTSDADSGLGNYIGFYYSLGYEIFDDFTLAANVGYAFEDIGSMGSGRNKTAIYATGMSYGIGSYYDFTKHISVGLEYKKYDLSYEDSFFTLKDDIDSIGLKVFYNF